MQRTPRPRRSILERVRVVSPCKADWESMTGNEEVRFCDHCRKSVHDLSAMTRKDAQALVAKSNGRLCIRYRRSSDNRIITKDALPVLPVPLYRIVQRASPLTAGIFTAALSFAATTMTAAAQTLPSDSPVITTEGLNRSDAQIQSGTASLSGTVFDPAGAVIPRAIVILTQTSTRLQRTVQTSEEGAYRFQNIGDGSYSLAVEAVGFARAEVTAITLLAGEERHIDTTLEIGEEVVTMGVIGVASPVENWIRHFDKRTDEEEATIDDRVFDFQAAITGGRWEAVSEMLNAGMNVDTANQYGETSLMLFIYEKTAVERLLRAGANVNATSRFGVTPLMYAMLNEDTEVARLLIMRGASVNHRDVDGRSALMFAAFDGRLEMIRTLLEAGADAHARDNEGKSVLRYAIEGNREEAAALLRAAGAVE